MIILVTGTPGSGKTLFVVSKILELQKQFPDRKIYSDIDGLQIDGVEQSPEDWRTTPDNSIVIYDEAQQHERFRAGTQANKDEIVQKLQVHRHTGHDIWFITQSPRFLNAFVLDLVGEHYHLHRPYGAKLASVYYWRSVRKQPQSLASRELAENEFLFKYPKQLFDVYKSATQHNVKLKLPKKLFMVLGAMLALGGLVYKMVFADGTQKMVNGQLGPSTAVASSASSPPVAFGSAPAAASTLQNLEQECRKGVNVEKPECVKWFNDLSKNGSSVTASGVQSVSYNPNKPYDFEYQPQVQPTDFPRMSGVIKLSSGKLMAVDQQGNYMLNVSQHDCKRWLDGYRPFNYFAQSQNEQSQRSVGEQQQVNPESSSL